MAATVQQVLLKTKEACAQALYLIAVAVRTNAQSDIDAAVAAIDRTNVVRVKPGYSVDGEQVDWNQYRQSLTAEITELNKLIQAEDSPWVVESRMRP